MKQIKVSSAVYLKLMAHKITMEEKLQRTVTFTEVVEYYQSKIEEN